MEKAELSKPKNNPIRDVERAASGRKALFPEGSGAVGGGGTLNSESESQGRGVGHRVIPEVIKQIILPCTPGSLLLPLICLWNGWFKGLLLGSMGNDQLLCEVGEA